MKALPTIEWNAISRKRSELMGFAMLIIVLFHVYLPRTDIFFGLRRTGNIGVDIFFFLSGMGLWYAWTKARNNQAEQQFFPIYGQFLRRRLIRIYPAWLLMASLYYVPDYLNHGGHSLSVVDMLGDILINWDFWLHDELTFWYIPAILVLYLVAPFYMELIRRQPDYRWLPVLALVWCVAVQWVTPIHQAVGHIEIFWSRVPIFFLGVNIGDWVKQQKVQDGSVWWLALLFVCLPLYCSIHLEQMHHGRYPLFVSRLIYIPLVVAGCLTLAHLLQKLPSQISRCLAFVGTISLETYLIHVHFVLRYIEPHRLGYWPTALLCLLFTLPLAWILHIVVEKIVNKIQ